jgi:copper resistance protein C
MGIFLIRGRVHGAYHCECVVGHRPPCAGRRRPCHRAAWFCPSRCRPYRTVSSNPEDGATLASPPSVITLTFNESVEGEFSAVVVLDAAGAHHESGEPQVAGVQVTQAVGALDAGSFNISYRIVSEDGHPVEGTLAFSITGPAPTATRTAAAAAPSAAAASPSATTDTADVAPAAATSGTPMWVVVLIVALAAAALATAVVSARAPRGHRFATAVMRRQPTRRPWSQQCRPKVPRRFVTSRTR